MASLSRIRTLLEPRSVAVLGAGPSVPGSQEALASLAASDADIRTSLAERADVVLSFLDGESSIALAEQAAAAGCGGLVVLAAGFREAGPDGAVREERLLAAAGDAVALCGPNCAGFVNARRGLRLTGGPQIPLRHGGIGVITQSGGGIAASMLAAHERRLGFTYLVSPGNETQLDLVDYLDFLLDDEDTRVICLAIESIRRPAAFVEVAERALEIGKPLVALRLVRGRRAREIARSHTGAIVEDGADLDAAFASLGIVQAATFDELLDAAVPFEQLARIRWRPLRGVGVLTNVGGGAELVSDLFEQRRIPLPPLAELRTPLGVDTATNPLDLVTAGALGRGDFFGTALPHYLAHPKLDALVLVRGLDEWFRRFGDETIYGRFAAAAAQTDKALLIASLVDSRVGDWVDELPPDSVARARGLDGLLTALDALDTFARAAPRAAPAGIAALPPPPSLPSEVGPIVPFADVMELLCSLGLDVAPFRVLGEHDAVEVDLDAPYAVKLADVPHRARLGVLRLDVPRDGLADAVDGLRRLARERGLPADVAVQPQVSSRAEAFIGLDRTGAFGPTIVCGVGGSGVESAPRAARLAPLSPGDADAMLEELDAKAGILARGLWNADRVAASLLAVGELAVAAPWLRSLDVNPLLCTAEAAVAVDALAVVEP